MKKNKGRILIKMLGQLLKSVWKLLLLSTYAAAKIVAVISTMISKIVENMLN